MPGVFRDTCKWYFQHIYFARRSGHEVLWWSRLCVCLSASISSEPHTIFTKFLVHVVCGRGWVIFRQGDKIPRGRGNLGFSSTLTMHCNVLAVKGMIQSPIMSCSRRDHSVAATFAANGIGREGGDGVHSAGEVWSMIALLYSMW